MALTITENTFQSWDGTELFYRSWTAEKKAQKALILFHRGHEHSGRWQDVIDKLDLPDFAILAWDARGHGKSPGERGDAESFGAMVKDADTFVRHIVSTYGIDYADIAVLAHSVGSVLASTWIHDFAPPVRALVLGSPALRIRLYVPFAIPGLRLLQKIRGNFFISSYVKGRLLTHDPQKQESYDNDPLVTPNISVRILLGVHDAATRLLSDSGAITVPTLMLTSGADFVVKQSAQQAFFEGLRSRRKQRESFAGFFHDTFNERDSHLPIVRAREFILDAFSRDPEPETLLEADRYGYTREEFDRLRLPLSPLSLKGLGFSITKYLMKTVGRLSRGIDVGWETGFDSGTMLDYVYRNEAQGVTPLGRLMDRMYLDSPGWKGIRQRKVNLEKHLGRCIEQILAKDGEARIADIATGHGRYVLDAIKAHEGKAVSALLRDYSDLNISSGRALAADMGLGTITYEIADAFDQEVVASLGNTPNIAIVSGLYELFPDNAPIRDSLAGLAQAVQPGGYLIYTNQPWHPQLEFIARVLSSHRGGQDWVMRRRTQQEMDQLVADAGFEKFDMDIDEDGIFSVSVARRV